MLSTIPLPHVNNLNDYTEWLQDTLAPTLQQVNHQMRTLVSMVARLGGEVPTIELVIGRQCDDATLRQMEPYLYGLLQQWLGQREPCWLSPNSHTPCICLHGQMDLSGRMASLFWWLGRELPSPQQRQQHNQLTQYLTPYLHAGLQQILHQQLVEQRPSLTNKETEILQWIAQGRSNREIATILQKSESTVRNQIHCLFSKLQASNRVEALQLAEQYGLLSNWYWKKPTLSPSI